MRRQNNIYRAMLCRGLVIAITVAALGGMAAQASAQAGLELLAAKIAQSLSQNIGEQYKTVAFYRIRQSGNRINTDELIDFTNVKIVQERRLRVIDRSKLQLILQEQEVQLSDFVSAEKYQELGKLIGVDLFVYGTLYRDALVLKAIDVQNSAIAWAEMFAVAENPQEATILKRISDKTVASLSRDLARLKSENINFISFWDITANGIFDPAAVMDFLSVAITRSGDFKVIDRENIDLIAKEQALNQSVFINQESAKRLGELYGVDAFLYGGITRRSDGTFLASLKLLNIYNGVLEWGDLIKVSLPKKSKDTRGAGKSSGAQGGMVYVPGGMSVMGVNGSLQEAAPAHQVQLKGYYIDRTEVTNRKYQAFVKKKRYRAPINWRGTVFPPGSGEVPVVNVSWEDARRYCLFAGKRLPTEAEWEKAARGSDGRLYPWKGKASASNAVTRESGSKAPVPVTNNKRDLSPYGVANMAGNVREWVRDVFAPYRGSSSKNPNYKRNRVVRGGSWATSMRAATTYWRGSSKPNLGWPDLGIRCAKDAP